MSDDDGGGDVQPVLESTKTGADRERDEQVTRRFVAHMQKHPKIVKKDERERLARFVSVTDKRGEDSNTYRFNDIVAFCVKVRLCRATRARAARAPVPCAVPSIHHCACARAVIAVRGAADAAKRRHAVRAASGADQRRQGSQGRHRPDRRRLRPAAVRDQHVRGVPQAPERGQLLRAGVPAVAVGAGAPDDRRLPEE